MRAVVGVAEVRAACAACYTLSNGSAVTDIATLISLFELPHNRPQLRRL
jgi:hypothetical protein